MMYEKKLNQGLHLKISFCAEYTHAKMDGSIKTVMNFITICI